MRLSDTSFSFIAAWHLRGQKPLSPFHAMTHGLAFLDGDIVFIAVICLAAAAGESDSPFRNTHLSDAGQRHKASHA